MFILKSNDLKVFTHLFSPWHIVMMHAVRVHLGFVFSCVWENKTWLQADVLPHSVRASRKCPRPFFNHHKMAAWIWKSVAANITYIFLWIVHFCEYDVWQSLKMQITIKTKTVFIDSTFQCIKKCHHQHHVHTNGTDLILILAATDFHTQQCLLYVCINAPPDMMGMWFKTRTVLTLNDATQGNLLCPFILYFVIYIISWCWCSWS